MKERTGLKPIDELVLLAREGNGLAFTALWDRHIGQLRLFIKGMVKNLDDFDVDDICSRSFEKAFRQIGNYDPARSRFTTWLWTIARNTALDFVEQDKRVHPRDVLVSLEREIRKDPLEEIPEQAQNALDSMIHSEDDAEQANYIERLPALYREVARKRLVYDMQYKEIAEEMDLELNTVKTRLRRAKGLMEEMRRQDKEDEENER